MPAARIVGMTLNILVLTTATFDDTQLDRIRAVAPDARLTHAAARDAEALPADLWSELDVLYTVDALPEPERVPRLRWVQLHFAGVEDVVHQALARRVPITNASGVHSTAIAEWTLAAILARSRRLPLAFGLQQKSIWPKDRWGLFVPDELRGATVGIVGYGAIGREIGRLCAAFGMNVIGLRRGSGASGGSGGANADRPRWIAPDLRDLPPAPARIEPIDALPDVLPLCDVVVLALPLTSTTERLFNGATLQRMKPGSLLLNIGRGGVIDEPALVAGLAAGQPGAAALDVFAAEPLPAESPLWSAPNVIITPHVSGFSPRYDERAMTLFADNLTRFQNGEPLFNLVDVDAGY